MLHFPKIASHIYACKQLFLQRLTQFLLIVSLVFPNGIQAEKKGSRMNNAEQATHGQFPMVAALLTPNSDIVCEGTLLTMKVVLTAGHCFTGFQQPEYCVAGSTGVNTDKLDKEFVRKIVGVQVHPNFLISIEFDLALARLDKPYDVGPHIKAAKLASEDIVYGEECFLPGWDSDEGEKKKLMYRKIKTLSKEDCGFGQTTVLFAGYEDNGSCIFTDHGEPLLCGANNLQLYGIMTEKMTTKQTYCPFTNVKSVRDWITSVVPPTEKTYSLTYSEIKILNKTNCGFGETTMVFAGVDGNNDCVATDSGGPLLCGANQVIYASLTEKMTAQQSYCPFSAVMASKKWIVDNLRGDLGLTSESTKTTTDSILWRLHIAFHFAISIAKLFHGKDGVSPSV